MANATTHTAVMRRARAAPLQDGIAAIFNTESVDFGRSVEIREVEVTSPGSWNTGMAGGPTVALTRLVRITDYTLGDGTLVTAINLDNNSSALPSQVTAGSYPLAIVETDTFKPGLADPWAVSNAAGNNLMMRLGGRYGVRGDSASGMYRSLGGTSVESIILREGEGFAVVQDTVGLPLTKNYSITVKVVATGATHVFYIEGQGPPDRRQQAYFAILNGSGSGVVLEVLNVEATECAEQTTPQFRLARISGFVRPGTAVTACTHDKANSLPAAIQCIKGPFLAALAGTEYGVPQDWHENPAINVAVAQQQNYGTLRRSTLGQRVCAQNAASTFGFVGPGKFSTSLFKARTGIVLRPGEGIAILNGRVGTIDAMAGNFVDVTFTFTHQVDGIGRVSQGLHALESGIYA